MNTIERLTRIQKLSNLYIDRSIAFCDSKSSVMYELKDNIRDLLESRVYFNCIDDFSKDLDPQLASLAAHLEPSLKDKKIFDTYLIVGGVGRSGTTAFGAALNNLFGSQYNFFMFTERYSWKLPYSPTSFSSDFIFREDSRNSQESIQDKFSKFLDAPSSYDTINFVGDKRPGASYMLGINDMFFSHYHKKLLYLHLYRDPIPTALSWQKRAEDASDPWPRSWESEMMARHYISQAKITLDFAKSSQLKSTQIKFVDYDRFFFDKDYCAKCFDYVKDYLGISAIKTFEGSKNVSDFVEKNKDFALKRFRNASASPNKTSRLLERSRNVYRKLRNYDI